MRLTGPFRDARRFPSRIVARTDGYTYAVGVWDLSIVQGPFPVAPVPNPTRYDSQLFHRCTPRTSSGARTSRVADGAGRGVRFVWGTQPVLDKLKLDDCLTPSSPGADLGLSRRQILSALTTAVGGAVVAVRLPR
jgi:hypothetical protein